MNGCREYIYDDWRGEAPPEHAGRDEAQEAADRDDELVHNWPKLARLVDWRRRHAR